MNAELSRKLYEKYPAIFRNRCEFSHGDGWYGILDVLCEALGETRTTCILVDEARGKAWGIKPYADTLGNPHYPMYTHGPQVIALRVQEKYGTLRFSYRLEFEPRFHELTCGENALPEAIHLADRYHDFIDGIIQLAETLSGRTCEETGKEGELHVSSGDGWWRTLNREFAQTDPQCRNRNYVPVNKENP